ncbi:ATP-binding cassette domain-containing protein [Methylocystis sp.]|uniref:ATP-binding cassette domain-containing protein n=1 Tax=Methylocystis sp. TaxID=1911079 RepID=UPI003DA56214
MSMIDVKGLNFAFGQGELRRQVLTNIHLSIETGEIVILTGPSGSGKTTLLTILGGLRLATSGSVVVLGEQLVRSETSTRIAVRRQTGYIFQQHNLFLSLTATENVCMALELHDFFSEKERVGLARQILTQVGLEERLEYRPQQLSGGQRQRVSIARALVSRPKIVLADEPTASLDKNSGHEAVEILRNLAKQNGTTILIVTHDYRILDIADRIINLEDGVIK